MTENNDRVTPDPSTRVSDGMHPVKEIHKKIQQVFIEDMKDLIS